MKFTLLTSFKELERPSNTGKLVVEVLGENAEQLRWERNASPPGLLGAIAAGGVALVYPGPADEQDGNFAGVDHVILIDSTWHEARKIHQKSPYLQRVRRISLKPSGPSAYNLRRNQKESGLCTAECVIEVLRRTGHDEDADRLEARFRALLRPPASPLFSI